jgi:hypothetical protein
MLNTGMISPHSKNFAPNSIAHPISHFLDQGLTLQVKATCIGVLQQVDTSDPKYPYYHVLDSNDISILPRYLRNCKESCSINSVAVSINSILQTRFQIRRCRPRRVQNSLPPKQKTKNVQTKQSFPTLKKSTTDLWRRSGTDRSSKYELKSITRDATNKIRFSKVWDHLCSKDLDMEVSNVPVLPAALACLNAMEGDLICVLLGSYAPMVFHPVNDYYVVVGGIVVPGYSGGQAIEGIAEGTRILEDFNLH